MLGIELSNEGHPLESPYRVDPARIEHDGLVGPPGEFGPLRLARVAAAPLPETQSHEHHAQHHRAQCERPRRCETIPAGIAQCAAAYTLGGMQYLLRPLVFCLLIAIFVSLASALRHLSRGTGEEDSRKMARALTIRISLSIALFVLLVIAWYMGLISPHGLQSSVPVR